MIISKKTTKYFAIFIITIFIISAAIGCFTAQPIFAEEENSSLERAMGFRVSYQLKGENSNIIGVAKNIFNIYLDDINVYIYLYMSETYEESYVNMILCDWNYSQNLKVGQELYVQHTTGNKQLYWKLRVRYRRDGKDWEEEVSQTYLVDGDGNLLK